MMTTTTVSEQFLHGVSMARLGCQSDCTQSDVEACVREDLVALLTYQANRRRAGRKRKWASDRDKWAQANRTRALKKKALTHGD